ncbi:MAG TPA: hypothetical protein VK614_00905 [Allosphingosinicella sp.]|nr:hypothetical protein [Allosphingosinicella sp.]
MWLLLLAAQAAAPAQPRQAVLGVEVIGEGAPVAEQRVERRQPFAQQRVILESGIVFDIAPAALDALRERFHLDARHRFVLSEWVAVGPGPGLELRRLGLLHCASRVTWGTNHTCLRDQDADGRLDGVAVYRNNIPAEGLSFQPIEPIPYHYIQAPRSGEGGYSETSLGFGWDRERDGGRLRFFAQAAGFSYRAEIDPSVIVDPAQLPATIEIGGAQLTVLSYDGRRPAVRVDRPFPSRPIRLLSLGGFSDSGVYLSIMGGTGHDWRLEPNDISLPGAPAPR